MTHFTPDQALAAVRAHKTEFFDAALRPVRPVDGQWFCEFELVEPHRGGAYMRAEALVEYIGATSVTTSDGVSRIAHRVCPDSDDADREPRGLVLILQR